MNNTTPIQPIGIPKNPPVIINNNQFRFIDNGLSTSTLYLIKRKLELEFKTETHFSTSLPSANFENIPTNTNNINGRIGSLKPEDITRNSH